MDLNVLKYFYKELEDGNNIFLKSLFIRLIRNKIIDPNTNNFLADGFLFYDYKVDTKVSIPCDDSNWCEYETYDKGFKLGILNFPFSLKLHNNYFFTIEKYEEFEEILKQVIEFRVNTIKKGWAIKYGFEYESIKYDLLEDLSETQLLTWKDPRNKCRYYLDNIQEKDLI